MVDTNLKTRDLDIIADLENADINIINDFWVDEFKKWDSNREIENKGNN